MKIALIYVEADPWALGPRTISAVLKKAGNDTRLILMGTEQDHFPQSVLEKAKKLCTDVDLIGISSFSRGSEKAKELIHFLKSLSKLIVWGGVHATLYPEECAKAADLVCRGEGEHFMLELAERIDRGRDWRDIANGAYVHDGKMVINDLRPLIDDLDELPLPDYSRADEYLLSDRGFRRVEVAPGPGEPIMFTGSRGCAFHCNYCSNAKLKKLFSGAGPYVRKMSIKKYVEQAAALRDLQPKAGYFYLVDEDLMARTVEELREFAEKFPEKVGLPFECMASPPMVSEEKMELLVKAGLWRIDVGVESGSERTKKEVFDRPISNSAVIKAATTINRYPQVVPYYFLIIGNPYEERQDLLDTISLIRHLPTPFHLRTYNLVFLPGSLLYDLAKKDGIINGKKDSGFEIDFLAGLEYRGQSWKRKELYLNGLLFLMSGRNTTWRSGLVPRGLLAFLLMPKLVKFNSAYPALIKAMIRSQLLATRIRRQILVLLRKVVRDPRRLYGVRVRPVPLQEKG
jgi:radical SAM superfamily enzyme YgiQ (UPF0313 family)